MKKINLRFEEESNANKVCLRVEFAGGDGDTEHPEDNLLKCTFDNIDVAEVEKEFNNYNTLKDILDINSAGKLECYEEVKDKHGKEIASLYDNAPNDPQSDHQYKCYIDSISLVAYDKKGDKYISYL